VSPIKGAQLKKNNYESQLGLAIFAPSKSVCLTNHWLAGFLDADGSLGIFIASLTHKHKKSVRLEIKFSQKDDCILNLIAQVFAVKKFYKNQKTQIHVLTITANARIQRFMDYLDHYHLQTKKYTQYCIFRHCYRFMQAKKHLLHDGFEAVKVFKTSLQKVYK
jgi:LAGLIDADG endonuclease